MRSVLVVENLQQGKNSSFCESWNLMSSSSNTFSLKRSIPIFTGHRLNNIGQSKTYFFQLPLTQHLILSRQNQNTCSTLLLEGNFFVSLYIGAEVPCLPIPTLKLHKVRVLVCIAQYHLAEFGGIRKQVVNLQHRCALCHTMLWKIKGLLVHA